MKQVAEPTSRMCAFPNLGARAAVARRHHQVLSGADFLTRVHGLAARLAARPESAWGICCEDAFYFLCGLCAVLSSGKRAVIPPNFQPGTLAGFDGEVEGWIVDRPDSLTEGRRPCIAVDDIVGAVPAPLSLPETGVIDLFTSGTTGAPKRVRKLLSQLTSEVEVLEASWGKHIGDAPVLATVPHHHIYGVLFRLLWPLCAGRVFDVTVCSNPDEFHQRLQACGRAVLISSPAQLARWPELIDLKTLAPDVVSIYSSGGPLPAAAAAAYRQALRMAPIEVYGSSETGGIAWRAQDAQADGDTWTPLPRVQVQLAADGALQVRSPYVGGDTWFTTADGAQLLDDGRFRLLDRLDRVIKVEEKRLSLPEMERRLSQHPWIAAAAVVALEDRRRLIGVAAVLSPIGREQLQRDGKRAIGAELKNYLNLYYEPALLPRRWRFPDALPLNDRGKISFAALADLFARAD